MTLRTGHGNGAGSPRIEVFPPNELPLGVREPERVDTRAERAPDGRWLPGCKGTGAIGGRANAGKARLTNRLGIAVEVDGSEFKPYRRAAASFRRIQCHELARTVGGGYCGPAASTVVASAALALAWSRYFSDKAAATGDPDMAMRSARLGETSRQHLLAAWEICAKEAQTRPKQRLDPLDAFMPKGDAG